MLSCKESGILYIYIYIHMFIHRTLNPNYMVKLCRLWNYFFKVVYVPLFFLEKMWIKFYYYKTL